MAIFAFRWQGVYVGATSPMKRHCEIWSAFVALNRLQFYVAKASWVIFLEFEKASHVHLMGLALCRPSVAPFAGAVTVLSSDDLRVPLIAGGMSPQTQSLAASCPSSHIPGILISWERWDNVCLPHSRLGENALFQRERAWRVCLAAPSPQAVQ